MSGRPFTFWRALPLIGEPASSYFSRLVMDECNHLPEVYASEVGVAPIFKSQELLDRIFLLPISEGDKERLVHWTPLERNGRIDLAGQTFRRNEFRWSRRLECQQCVAEIPYQRVWWHFEFFRSCPVHRCRLQPVRGGQTRSGRWWPRFDHATRERLPDIELGNAGDTIESYIISCLMSPSPRTSRRHLSDFIAAAEFAGRLLNNRRQPTVPTFSPEDLETGHLALKDGISGFTESFRRWLNYNPPTACAYHPRDVVGWAAEYALDHSGSFDPDTDDVPNPILGEISAIIQAECERVLAR